MDDNELKAKVSEEKSKRIQTISVNATIITALITASVSFLSGYIDIRKDNHVHIRENTKIELDYAEKFMDTALAEDINVRLRFSEYFMYIFPSADQRERWNQYYLLIKDEQLQQMRDSLKAEIQNPK